MLEHRACILLCVAVPLQVLTIHTPFDLLRTYVQVWDIARERLTHTCSHHAKGIHSFVWCKAYSLFASCGIERDVVIWQVCCVCFVCVFMCEQCVLATCRLLAVCLLWH